MRFSLSLGVAAFAVAVWSTRLALGGPVLLTDISGTAKAFSIGDQVIPSLSDSHPLVRAPDSGTAHILDPRTPAGSPVVNSADLSWKFTNSATAAGLAFHINATIYDSPTGGDVKMSFVTRAPLDYHFRVGTNFGGTGLDGRLDAIDLGIFNDPDNSGEPNIYTRQSQGLLPAGKHQLSLHGETFIFRFDANFDMLGDVTLRLAPVGSAVPLPAAFWPGITLLAGLLGCEMMLRRVRRQTARIKHAGCVPSN